MAVGWGFAVGAWVDPWWNEFCSCRSQRRRQKMGKYQSLAGWAAVVELWVWKFSLQVPGVLCQGGNAGLSSTGFIESAVWNINLWELGAFPSSFCASLQRDFGSESWCVLCVVKHWARTWFTSYLSKNSHFIAVKQQQVAWMCSLPIKNPACFWITGWGLLIAQWSLVWASAVLFDWWHSSFSAFRILLFTPHHMWSTANPVVCIKKSPPAPPEQHVLLHVYLNYLICV